MISAVVAMSQNHVIGKNNQLPWHCPADLRHFKQLTSGHTVLMGRKTFLSIGKPLPNRTNIVLSRDPHFQAPGCQVITSIDKFLAEELPSEIFIIGGAEIFKQALPYIQRIYLTIIHHDFDGDTFFPELKRDEWQQITRIDHPANPENPYAFSFLTLEKKGFNRD